MKYYLLSVVCFFNSFLYSQIKQNTDSVSYYNKLANKKLNSKVYNEAVFFTKKSSEFCDTINIPENLGEQTFTLGYCFYNQR